MRIVFLNCYCFPISKKTQCLKYIGIDLHARVYECPAARIKHIAKYVKTLNADVICFQELWKSQNKKLMLSYFPTYYESYDKNRGRFCGIGVDSGLLTLTKAPHTNTRMLYFETRTKLGEDQLATKGALTVDILHTDNKNILTVVNTHLQGGVTKEQLMEIHENKLLLGSQSILCGDLNIRVMRENKTWNTHSFDSEVKVLNLKSPDYVETLSASAYESDRILDHILVSHDINICKYIIDRKTIASQWSDHAISIVDLDL